ncbi:fibropellin-1 [Aplysia californica]|uniref:Fibropellin-1 n=1 Tax=Aplysia californica TaxID=6500 RepID=A0ABM1A318_APLCA|nr:fibropellin-1 [Aplysia californica]
MCLCPSYSMYTFGVAGFGSECTKLRLPCDAYPCLNGARCEPYGNIRRRCLCQQGYTGDSCELDIDSCLSNPCKNGADCIDGPSGDVTCVCPNGFSGELCEQRVNRCDVTTCPSFANCVDNYETDELVCICQVGFQKDAFGNCVQVVSNVCSPNPCLNSGVCYRDGASYKCFCTPGYEGARCQHNIDDCEPNPCQHGGVCTDVEPPPSSTSGRFTCQCNSDTYGNTCLDGVDICQGASNPCLAGHSRCIDLYRDYFCECEQGYYGKNCTEKGNLQCGSFPCQHGGTCVETGTSYFCQCPDGYTGANCASIVDNCVGNPCLNTGNCGRTLRLLGSDKMPLALQTSTPAKFVLHNGAAPSFFLRQS